MVPGTDVLLPILEDGKYNWFEVVDYIEQETSTCVSESPFLVSYLNSMFSKIINELPDSKNKGLLEQSYNASCPALMLQKHGNYVVASFNWEIVSLRVTQQYRQTSDLRKSKPL